METAVKIIRHCFTVEEYHQMAQAGILSEDERVELLEGEIVEMTPISSRHAACVKRINRLFSQAATGSVIVSVQDPIRLTGHSEPQPDLALLKPRADFYAATHPEPKEVLLVVEVAETSAAYDREAKIPLYARAGIPEAWLVDLQGEVIEIHLEPSTQGDREVRRLGRGQSLSLQTLPDLTLAVDDALYETDRAAQKQSSGN